MKIRVVLWMLAVIQLAGCGMFGNDGLIRNRSHDYLESDELQPIVVPEELDTKALGQLYSIPPVSETATLDSSREVPRPLPLGENLFKEEVKIQKLADDAWILINKSPSEVWPRLRNILNRSSIPAAKTDAPAGVLETVWLSFQEDNVASHRFRFYLEPGVQLNSTEIKILHNQVTKGEEEKGTWSRSSDSASREKEMIELVANAIAGDISSGTVSMLAQTIGGDAKVELVMPTVADPYLIIRMGLDRSWASISYSVSRGGFKIIDQNRSDGVLYIHYQPVEAKEKPGLLKRLFADDLEEEEITDFNYQVLVVKGDDGVEVRIADSKRGSIDRDEAVHLLQLIRGNLS